MRSSFRYQLHELLYYRVEIEWSVCEIRQNASICFRISPYNLTMPLKPNAFFYDPQLATSLQDMVQHTCLAFSMH